MINWLRRRLNRRVVEALRNERRMLLLEIEHERGWDGVPAPLVARYNTLQHCIDILESDYR